MPVRYVTEAITQAAHILRRSRNRLGSHRLCSRVRCPRPAWYVPIRKKGSKLYLTMTNFIRHRCVTAAVIRYSFISKTVSLVENDLLISSFSSCQKELSNARMHVSYIIVRLTSELSFINCKNARIFFRSLRVIFRKIIFNFDLTC